MCSSVQQRGSAVQQGGSARVAVRQCAAVCGSVECSSTHGSVRSSGRQCVTLCGSARGSV
jgi:hypothetical protein